MKPYYKHAGITIYHGAVSARQHHYLKTHDIKMKSEWDEWFESEKHPPPRERHRNRLHAAIR
jgi:hypothetical protein